MFMMSVFVSTGQNMYQIFEDSLVKSQMIRLTSFNDYSTTSINNAFASKFIFGGHIDNTLKADNSQKNFNSVGGEFNQKVEYFNGHVFKNHDNIGLTIAISDNNFISSNYKPAVWDLAFLGNASFLGDTLDLSFSHFQYLHYQKYDIGIYDKTTASYIRLGFLSGNQSINYQLGDSKFYTAANGDNIYIALNGEGFSTDSSSGYFSSQGFGAALEINHNFLFEDKSGNHQIVNFNLSNIGAIRWNSNTNYQIIDSNYQFSGINYSDIDYYSNFSNEDLVDSLGIIEGQNSRVESLPIRIGIQKVPHRGSSKKIQAIMGFKAILLPDYRPLIYAGAYYKPLESVSLSSRVVFWRLWRY